ncbi:hypothetical protein HWV62_9893 [Athelia sp. TMB]|nr:hypothetical protein HWV62_9893 [Athelia sp. TMB]
MLAFIKKKRKPKRAQVIDSAQASASTQPFSHQPGSSLHSPSNEAAASSAVPALALATPPSQLPSSAGTSTVVTPTTLGVPTTNSTNQINRTSSQLSTQSLSVPSPTATTSSISEAPDSPPALPSSALVLFGEPGSQQIVVPQSFSTSTTTTAFVAPAAPLFVTGYTEGNVYNITGDFYEANATPHALDLLKLLDPVVMNAAYRHQCLPGTRNALLESILHDLTVPIPDTNVIWLTGLAGSGKSTLATTIAEYLHNEGLLGAFLFFDRNSPSQSGPDVVIRTLAYQLAMSNKAIRDVICDVIEADPQIANRTLTHQFSDLLLRPLQACSSEITKPIVVILDAFDECGDPLSRRTLAYLLAEQLHSLPHQLRFVITGRPQLDLNNTFGSRPSVKAMSLNDSQWESDADVLLYIQHELDRLCQSRQVSDELPMGWPGTARARQLGERAADSFIYAATAMRYLYSADDVDERLDRLLDQTAFTLEDLYATALRSASNWDPSEHATESCRKILGAVVVGRIALTDDTIVDILGFEKSKACRIVLRKLACVLQWSEGSPVRTLHATFADYLTDPRSCGHQPWFIDEMKYQLDFTIGCLRVMKRFLRFNMCMLETSYLLNRDVPNLAKRIEDHIPRCLSYSCRFWAEHFTRAGSADAQVSTLMLEFFRTSFLYWLEALSLIGEGRIALTAMIAIETHSKGSFSDARPFVKDSIKFTRAFASIIADSAPHIYISALPFSPSESILKRQYAPTLPSTLRIQSGGKSQWPPCEQIIAGHGRFPSGPARPVKGATISPDGERIVSCSYDEFIRIWNARTGAPVSVITTHDKSSDALVEAVAISPDGDRVVSSRVSINIWDAWTGELLTGPLIGHTASVTSLAFSPDGSRIVSGSNDRTIRVWDARMGKPVAGPFKGHTESVTSVMFLPDGERIVSGSRDKTICIWDAQTGKLVVGPLEGHTHTVTSVAVCCNSVYIVSGSDDKTIRVWDMRTGELIKGPFQEHTDGVTSVAFSPDGERIVSGSDDRTIRVRSTFTWEVIAGPFEGHSGPIQSVMFLPDGEHIVSASRDGTIRVWYVQPEISSAGLFPGHSVDQDPIISVAFSPQGDLIASASKTKICIWDVQKGTLATDPIWIWDPQAGTPEDLPMTGDSSFMDSITFSPNGERIMISSWAGASRTWDAQTREFIALKAPNEPLAISDVLSARRERVAIAIDSWHPAIVDLYFRLGNSNTTHGPFRPNFDPVTSAAFSTDWERVVVASSDNKSVRVLATRTGEIIAGPFEGHTDTVTSLAFSPDGYHVVSGSGSSDRSIRIFDLRTDTRSVAGKGYCGGSRLVDGWMQNFPTELLFWVPPAYRAGLWRPYNTLLISEQSTRLDLSRFAHGNDWARCYDPPPKSFARRT